MSRYWLTYQSACFLSQVFPSALDQKDMHGESPYNIMFGPDICGPGTKKVHVIFAYKGKNLLVKKDIRCKDDVFSHLYTLVVKPDNSYIVKIDNKKVESGDLEADWDFLPPKKIKVRLLHTFTESAHKIT